MNKYMYGGASTSIGVLYGPNNCLYPLELRFSKLCIFSRLIFGMLYGHKWVKYCTAIDVDSLGSNFGEETFKKKLSRRNFQHISHTYYMATHKYLSHPQIV